MRKLQGKTVFLTGAASGIGRQLALQLANIGSNLLLVDRDEQGLDDVAKQAAAQGVQVHSYCCDLTQREAVSRTVTAAIADVGTVDVLINNAGVAWYGSTHDMTQAEWDWLMSINLLAPIQITQMLLPQLLDRPEAHIVNMCSIAGLVAGGRLAAYNTSKFGLVGFTESLRAEYGRAGIGVTAICPGPVSTKLYRSANKRQTGKTMPQPPAIVCTTPQRVASLTVKAIQRNRRSVLITPMAHGLFQLKRFLPGLLDAVSNFSRSSKRRRLERIAREERRLSGGNSTVDASSSSRAA
ncbi:MAG: SDR family oxidoreductase [Planctomycetaceae bacterium]|jgi:short-subunit dehydrogenase